METVELTIQARQPKAIKVAEKRHHRGGKGQFKLGVFEEHFALGCSLCSAQSHHPAEILNNLEKNTFPL